MKRALFAAPLLLLLALPAFADITFSTNGSFAASNSSTWTAATGVDVTFNGIATTTTATPYSGSLGTVGLSYNGTFIDGTNTNLKLNIVFTVPNHTSTFVDTVELDLLVNGKGELYLSSPFGGGPQQFTVGATDYLVTVSGVDLRVPYGSSSSAAIQGTVSAFPHVPEPGAVTMLLGFGAVGLAFSQRRRSA